MSLKTPQQAQYKRVQQKKEELQKAVNQAAKQAESEWLLRNSEFSNLAVKRLNIAYVRNKKGVSKGIIEIAKLLPFPENSRKTQKEILEKVMKQNPECELKPTIWSKSLSSGLLKKVHMLVRANSKLPFDLKGCDTLSKIRKRIKSSQDRAANKPYTFKPIIVITEEAVLINDTSYPLVLRKAKGIEYLCIRVSVKGKRCWVRIDALIEALKKR